MGQYNGLGDVGRVGKRWEGGVPGWGKVDGICSQGHMSMCERRAQDLALFSDPNPVSRQPQAAWIGVTD